MYKYLTPSYVRWLIDKDVEEVVVADTGVETETAESYQLATLTAPKIKVGTTLYERMESDDGGVAYERVEDDSS